LLFLPVTKKRKKEKKKRKEKRNPPQFHCSSFLARDL